MRAACAPLNLVELRLLRFHDDDVEELCRGPAMEGTHNPDMSTRKGCGPAKRANTARRVSYRRVFANSRCQFSPSSRPSTEFAK